MNDDATSIPPDARPRLPRGVRLVAERGPWRLDVAGAGARVQGRSDRGRDHQALHRARRRSTAIVDDLAAAFSAPRDRIAADVTAMLARSRRQDACWSCDVASAPAPPLPTAARPAGGADASLPARMPLLLQPARARPPRRRARRRDLGPRVQGSGRARRAAGPPVGRRAGARAATSSRSRLRRMPPGSTPI